jgi:hypothetical protein
VFRIEPDGDPTGRDGSVYVSFFPERIGQMPVRCDVVRVESDGRAVRGDCRIEITKRAARGPVR